MDIASYTVSHNTVLVECRDVDCGMQTVKFELLMQKKAAEQQVKYE